MNDLTIGSKLFWFDKHRRVYADPKPGDLYPKGGPIWEKSWREVTIVGESPRLWILSGIAGKIPKKGPLPEDYALDKLTIDRLAWKLAAPYKLADLLKTAPIDQLDQVAAILGYARAPT